MDRAPVLRQHLASRVDDDGLVDADGMLSPRNRKRDRLERAILSGGDRREAQHESQDRHRAADHSL